MLQKYSDLFKRVFNIEGEQALESLEYQGIKEWDSVGHMALIASIENEFDIQLDVDDVIDFSSFTEGKKILAKYGVVL